MGSHRLMEVSILIKVQHARYMEQKELGHLQESRDIQEWVGGPQPT